MEPVEAVVAGAGLRGRFVYGAYARAHPQRLRIVAVAEPDAQRRSAMAAEHAIPARLTFQDWRPMLEGPPLAAIAIIATGDTLHVEPALLALERGYHVLLEKPIATTPEQCVRVVEAAERAGRLLKIGHVLRHTPFYRRVHEIVTSGRLGEIVAIDMKEHVAHWHMTHSFVRGKFRSRRLAAPLLLAKCCHDLDLMAWFAGRPARRVTSYGALAHYRREKAPAGAPARCTDGCPVQQDCPYDAVRFYLGPEADLARMWPWSDLSADPSREARRRALETGRYGRCVYHCDNDLVDHQVVAVEFEDGLTGTFTVHGHATHEERTLRLTGSGGELRGLLHAGAIEVTRPGSLAKERERIEASPLGHFGGDEGLLDDFTARLRSAEACQADESGRAALESHLIGFAAEQARREGSGLEMASFREAARRAGSARG